VFRERTHPYLISVGYGVVSLSLPALSSPGVRYCCLYVCFCLCGSSSPLFYDFYFFTDYCSDRIWTLHKETDQWIKQDFGQFPGNNFVTFGEDASGQLYVAGIASGKIFRVNDLSTGSNPIKKPVDFKITHVPYSDIIHLETTENNQSEIEISVYDIRGTKQYQKEVREHNVEINLGFLPAGIYFLKVIFQGNSQIQKLVLEK